MEGSVHGKIYATDRLELAEIAGDIKATVLSMPADAVMVGTSSVGSGRPSRVTPSPTRTSRVQLRHNFSLRHPAPWVSLRP
ncbi:MAG: polymer-forming cytoskeletal protein [Roseibacillus sp.]|nr:polymer-forming cytoskeletal protein [Roseibacillus sp.]